MSAPNGFVPSDAEHVRGIAAIERTRELGFSFLHLRDEHGNVIGLHAERWRHGAVDLYALADQRDAVAARYRAEDYERAGDPLWQVTGTVANVIAELLALPPYGSPERRYAPSAPGPVSGYRDGGRRRSGVLSASVTP
ncbi:MAG: hypothetical protein GEU98_23575 [Pseudonocardiaceae bacterium]|nr:hypothetical protein [Pseudonocardiaceae bacterium]